MEGWGRGILGEMYSENVYSETHICISWTVLSFVSQQFFTLRVQHPFYSIKDGVLLALRNHVHLNVVYIAILD